MLGKQKVKGGTLREVDLGTERNLSAAVPKDYEAAENVEISLELDEKKVQAPVKKGDVLGSAVLIDEKGKELARRDLIALESAGEGGPLSRIGVADEDVPVFIIVVLTLAALGTVLLVLRKRK